MRKVNISLFCLGLLVVGLLGGGCATTTGSFSDYYYPDWTPDGKIICVKKVSEWSETGGYPIGGSTRTTTSVKYYITTISEEGTQETNIKEISGIGKVAASPLDNYIAYTEGDYIRVLNTSGNVINTINGGNKISSISWSSDEARIAFGIYKDDPSWEIYLISRDNDGALKKYLTLGDLGSWSKDGKYISYDSYVYAGNNPIDGGLYLYELSSDNITQLTTMEGAAPNYDINNNLLFYVNGNSIYSYDLLSGAKALLIYNQYLSDPKSNGLKIIYGKDNNAGIWISNVDGTALQQIK